jgi:hypothetical protein
VAAIEQQLNERATRRVTHEDRWRLEPPDDAFAMRHDRGNQLRGVTQKP